MYKDLENKLSTLVEPTPFKIKTFDELLAENIALAKEIIGTDWKPLESDPYMKKLRVLTLRQVHNQMDKKETFKQLLITTATDIDLDNLGAEFDVFRDEGEYPYAEFEFTLLTTQDKDVIIPAGLILNDINDNVRAYLVENITIVTGQISEIATVKLEKYIAESDIKTENIVSELTYAVDVKQLTLFSNGAEIESDDRYRLRIIASNAKYSTAGSVEAYKYFAYSADSRIDDITIPNDNNPLDVNIFIASFEVVDETMINNVYKACNAEYTRPLGDQRLFFYRSKFCRE